MKSNLFFTPFGCNFFNTLSLISILENAEKKHQAGEEVGIVYCDGQKGMTCWSNMSGNRLHCKLCKLYWHNLSSFLPLTVQLIPISSLIKETDIYAKGIDLNYNSVHDIKQIEYKKSKIGYAAYSTYLTYSRNLYPALDQKFRKYFDKLLRQGALYTDLALLVIEKYNPDNVAVYNSRIIYSRPIVDVCIDQKRHFTCFETTFSTNNEITITCFEDSMVHDVRNITERVYNCWNSDTIPIEKKVEIAEQFFVKRRNAIPAGDVVYIKDQKPGRLPENWNSEKKNILILNSSEDEYASLGEEHEKNTLFSSQYEGIKYIIETCKDNKDIHIYLRIHPNLKDITFQYHLKLYELAKISDNITIISPSSDISTYALIDAAEKVVVFASTTGTESVFWNKPVIQLSYSDYSLLNICYTPKTTEELNELLSMHLEPKDKLGALQYAYYLLNDEYEEYELYKINRVYIKLFSLSMVLYNIEFPKQKWRKYIVFALMTIAKVLFLSKNNYPLNEDASSFS